MRREDLCQWCKTTSKLVPIIQGGSVHTACADCGSNGPVLEFDKLRADYFAMRNLIIKAEPILREKAYHLNMEWYTASGNVLNDLADEFSKLI